LTLVVSLRHEAATVARELEPADESGVVDQLSRELSTEFADRVTAESLYVLKDTELSRGHERAVRDFVSIFVRRRVRPTAQSLRHTSRRAALTPGALLRMKNDEPEAVRPASCARSRS
jgi:hypothetical protein